MHNKFDKLTELTQSGTSGIQFTNEDGNITVLDTCNLIGGCTIDAFNNVSTSEVNPGDIFAWNGSNWTNLQLTVEFFLQASGNPAVETVNTTNTITFVPEGDISISVGPTREVSIGFTETLTSIADLGNPTGQIQYTDENGGTTNISICNILENSCSISNLKDVNIPTAPTTGDILVWNGSNWVKQAPSQETLTTITINSSGNTIDYVDEDGSTTPLDICPIVQNCTLPPISIFDGATNELVSLGESITFLSGGDVSVVITPTNTVTYSFTETNTTLTHPGGPSIRYTNEAGTNYDVNICTVIGGCSIGALFNVSAAAPNNGDVLTWNGGQWAPAVVAASGGASFACSNLNGCSIDNLGDVDTSGNDIGDTLSWDGSFWVNLPAGGFSCASLNTCSIDALSDVDTSGVSSNDILRWDGVKWAPSIDAPDILTSLSLSGPATLTYIDESGGSTNINLCTAISTCTGFTITDGATNQTINFGNTVTFSAGGDLSVAVSATDTVTYSFTEYLTSLTHISGGTIRYIDEDGDPTDLEICNLIGECSINNFGDVNASGASNGKGLIFNSGMWVAGFSSTTVSVSGTNCIDLGGDGSIGNPITVNPKIAGDSEVTDSDPEKGGKVFKNSLVCTAGGLFSPCIEIIDPTGTNIHDPFIFSIPCGLSQWDTIEVAQEEVIFGSFEDGDSIYDVGKAGPKIYIDRGFKGDDLLAEVFTRDTDEFNSLISKLPGTYGYYELGKALDGTTKTINHNLNSRICIVQIYDDATEIMQDLSNFTITQFDLQNIKISTTVNGNYNIAILPVFNLTNPNAGI